ncbi:MAG: hypothetical protein RR559_02820 [Bacteroides sp.]
MEDIMQFLVIAGIIAFGIYRQFSKEKNKNAENDIPMPIPPHTAEPPTPLDVVIKPSGKQPGKPLPVEGVRTTNTQSHSILPPSEEEKESEMKDCEFTIHSAEEARRAIIWSEILQRKY